VSVGQKDEVELLGIEREALEVERLLPVSALVHAAVDEEHGALHLHQVA